MVIQMGIPENHAKHALHNVGAAGPDQAVTWYFENMSDLCKSFCNHILELNEPLRVKKQGKKQDDGVSEESVQQITMMGFDEKKGRKALKKCVRTYLNVRMETWRGRWTGLCLIWMILTLMKR